MGGFCQNQRFLWPNIQIRPKTALRKGLRSAEAVGRDLGVNGGTIAHHLRGNLIISPDRLCRLKIGEREGCIEYQGRDETHRRGAEEQLREQRRATLFCRTGAKYQAAA